MPRSKEWTTRIPAALAAIRMSSAAVFPRNYIQTILGVSPRTGVRVMKTLGADLEHGRTGLISRESLIAALEKVQSGSTPEARRRQKLSDRLQAAAKEVAYRRVKIAPPPPGAEGPGAELRPGSVTFRFSTMEEFLTRLKQLADYISADPDAFREKIEK